ncbi:MAG: hypothetical protein ACYC1L_19405, partial [Alphaproteobacteria bacterium]
INPKNRELRRSVRSRMWFAGTLMAVLYAPGVFAASGSWELYSRTDEMTDQKMLTAEQDNIIDKINIQTTFECQLKQVELKFLLLNKSGDPYGSFENGNKYGYRSADSNYKLSEITYRMDERPPMDKVVSHKYVNALSLVFSPNGYDTENMAIPLESFLNGKRLRIKLPINEIGNPVLNLDLTDPKILQFKKTCRLNRNF